MCTIPLVSGAIGLRCLCLYTESAVALIRDNRSAAGVLPA